jgi:hypothetical protein
MTSFAFRSRLHHAFLMALLTPVAACGGTVRTSPGTPADSGTPEDSGTMEDDAAEDSATGADATADDSTMPLPEASCSNDGTPPQVPFCSSVWPPCGYDGGVLSAQECSAICPHDSGATGFGCSPTTVGGIEVIACNCNHTGRRPAGLSAPPRRGSTAGSFFAHCAWLEAASVVAFRHLGRELATHGAPAKLVARAARAAREEIRHTVTTSRLARRFGARTAIPQLPRGPVRSLQAIATENAVEGCVREAYGALVAMWMAERAADPEVREAFAVIGREEAGHAELAWRVAAWIEPQLDAQGRAAVERAKHEALALLRAEVGEEPSRELRMRAGVPGASEARRLLEAFARTMFEQVDVAA